MKKYLARILLIFLTLSFLCPVITVPTQGSLEEKVFIEVQKTEPILYLDFQYSMQSTSKNCFIQIEHCNSYIDFLKSQSLSIEVENEILRIENIINQYAYDYAELLRQEIIEKYWEEKSATYPEATKIWRIMKEEFGWNDIVCAGIMGNMMAEVAGGTLGALNKWDTNTSNGYGVIQWIGQRRKDIINKYGSTPTIEQQLYFMRDEMFGTNGVRKQITDAQLNAIMNATTPEQVAYNFAIYFERCASYGYNCRKDYARIAYNFFVN